MEGGWKTPPPRVSLRAKSPGLIGLKTKKYTSCDQYAYDQNVYGGGGGRGGGWGGG